MHYIEFASVRKKIGNHLLFENLSFAVNKGEIISICGPTGCGKSVVIRLLSGSEQIDGGKISIDGVDVHEQSFRERDLGVVFQKFALYPHMTGFENMASPLRVKGLSREEVQARVEKTARLLKIESILTHLPAEMSNGQRQRTALARALIKEPAILLFDDPLKNVDAKLSYEMRLELPRILSAFSCTGMYITQDFKEAMALGERILVLMDGRAMQYGSPHDVYEKPINLKVAQFFGDPAINHFHASVRTKSTSGTTLDLFGKTLDLPGLTFPKETKDVILGVRAEHVSLTKNPLAKAALKKTGSSSSLPMTIRTVTPLNVRFVFLIGTPDEKDLLASVPEYLGEALSGLQKIHVSFDLSKLHFFDPSTGERLPVKLAASKKPKVKK